MSMGSAPRGGKGRRRPMAEINMTPMVDVMLVLLVIFMIAAPALDKSGVDVQLPKTGGSANATGKVMPWSLTIDKNGSVYVAEKHLEPSEVKTQLPALLKGREKDVLTINGDARLPYETVMQVVQVIKNSGVEKINLAVQGFKQ